MRVFYHNYFILSCFLCFALFASASFAQSREELFNPSGLEIPRFVSLKSGKVFARKGPGKRFPIEWIYQKKDMPVEVIQEFDIWRRIRDFQGGEGWVHQNLISGERFALAVSEPYTQLYQKKDQASRVSAFVEKGAILRILACYPNWCKVKAENYKGWIEKKDLWGVYESEQFQ